MVVLVRFIKKVDWADVRQLIENQELVSIIDEIAPGPDLSLFHVRYHYGDYILNESDLHIPDDAGELVNIKSDKIPKSLREEFRYNFYSNPVSYILSGSAELFTEFNDRIIPFHGLMHKGSIFGTWFILAPSYWTLEPTFNWKLTAGARSIFMLPKIANKSQHEKLVRELNLNLGPPKTLHEQFDLFQEISAQSPDNWHMDVLYFGGKWFENLSDIKFIRLQNYFLKKAWQDSDFWRTRFIEDIMISFVQAHKGIIFDTHAIDRLRHIFAICAGFHKGLAITDDEAIAPIAAIKGAYQNVYGINFEPHIISLAHFDLTAPSPAPVYYSLNFENCQAFHPKSSSKESLLSELLNIDYVYHRFKKTLPQVVAKLDPSVLVKIFDEVQFQYIHAAASGRPGFITPQQLCQLDTRFVSTPFPENAPFLKAAVMISKANHK